VNWIKRLAVLLVTAYLLLLAGLYFFQERLIFHPSVLQADYRFEEGKEELIITEDGTRLHLLAFDRPDSEKAVLYLHGNRGSNRRSLYQTRELREMDASVYLMDYRGYGKSSGTLVREADLLADAQSVYDRLAARYGEENLIVVGYSLGTGPASYLAAENDPSHTVLVAPYSSLVDMKNRWFWFVPDFIHRYPLDNVNRLAASDTDITILHGKQDELIPFTMAERLRDLDPERVDLIPLANTGHRRAILHPAFGNTLRRLLAE
jgi:pimeloyl-ACP methyl ester carboxylesterase